MSDAKRDAGRTSDVSAIGTESSSEYLRTRFLERVAHDLRGPSGVALGALDEIDAALASDDLERVAPLLRIARRAQAKILRVAEKLSRTAMLRHDSPFEFAVIALGPIIERAAKAAESVEGRRSVKCVSDVSIDRDQIRGDAGWLEMILTELAADAITHSRTEMRVFARRTEEGIVVEVTGDGRAAPPAPRPLLAPSDDRRGLGVSMSLAAIVMEAHGGSFEAGQIGASPGVRLSFPKLSRAA